MTRSKRINTLLCGLIILLFTMTLFYSFFNIENNKILKSLNVEDINGDDPKPAAGLEIFQDPFKINLSKLWSFFNSKYKSNLGAEIDTYYRNGSSTGIIISNNVYSLDNILLYKSLLKDQVDYFETFDSYLKLQDTALWYQSSTDINEYGFVKSVDGTTGEIIDSTRYLIDNVMPIILLIENVGDQVTSFTVNSKYPKDSIEEMFDLIDSDQFWDGTNSGFYHHNSTNYKYAESNFYAILALLSIHKLYEQLGLNSIIKNRAFLLANTTINKVLTELWDNSNGGFDYYGKNDWSDETGSNFKYLETNAMGIISLLECWKETGIQPGSIYFQRALELFDIVEALWNSGFSAYEFSRDPFWGLS
ncbi:MAG: hypothetical protein ACFFKA_18405, partial [Candidatus Thorarchaeota archaeon]